MIELRGDFYFAQKAKHDALAFAGERDDLHRRFASERELFGAMHYALPAAPDALAQDEVAQLAPLELVPLRRAGVHGDGDCISPATFDYVSENVAAAVSTEVRL
jgi:hypothetical protein